MKTTILLPLLALPLLSINGFAQSVSDSWEWNEEKNTITIKEITGDGTKADMYFSDLILVGKKSTISKYKKRHEELFRTPLK